MRIAGRARGPDPDGPGRLGRARPLAVAVAVIVVLAAVFELDATTGSSPFQHLYYVPIVLAALLSGRYAGPLAAIASIVLYHLANPVLLNARYHESDVVQIVLFLAIGIVTAQLADDRRRLRRLAITDDLTGLYNLRGFEDRLTPCIRTARTGRQPLAMLVLDVDRLKSLNDTHGHVAGADAVRTVGQVIAAQLPAGAFACRFGGDEFVIALPGQGHAAAHATAQALCDAVHAVAPRLAGIDFPAGTLSISVGLASRSGADARPLATDDAAEGDALFRAADRALYVAKSGGRNRVSSPPDDGLADLHAGAARVADSAR